MLFSEEINLKDRARSVLDTENEARGIKISSDGSVDVNLQDSITRPLDLRFGRIVNPTIRLATVPVVGSYLLYFEPGHNLFADDLISIIQEGVGTFHHFLSAQIVGVDVNTITLDTPVPFPFSTTESFAYVRDSLMNVDGSGAPVLFNLANPFDTPADVTRIIFHITDNLIMDDSLFGGMPALLRGVLVRKLNSDGFYTNYFNFKTNGDLGELSSSKSYDTKAPAGVYGFTVAVTYAGQDNHGVALRINKGEALEILIQDDLTDLRSFSAFAQGHFVD